MKNIVISFFLGCGVLLFSVAADANNKNTKHKGNKSLGGKEMILIGVIGVDDQDTRYPIKTLPYQPDAEMQEKLDHYTVTSAI